MGSAGFFIETDLRLFAVEKRCSSYLDVRRDIFLPLRQTGLQGRSTTY